MGAAMASNLSDDARFQTNVLRAMHRRCLNGLQDNVMPAATAAELPTDLGLADAGALDPITVVPVPADTGVANLPEELAPQVETALEQATDAACYTAITVTSGFGLLILGVVGWRWVKVIYRWLKEILFDSNGDMRIEEKPIISLVAGCYFAGACGDNYDAAVYASNYGVSLWDCLQFAVDPSHWRFLKTTLYPIVALLLCCVFYNGCRCRNFRCKRGTEAFDEL